MSLVDWDSVTKVQDANAAYNRFLKFFSGLYDIAFPEQIVPGCQKAFKVLPKENIYI